MEYINVWTKYKLWMEAERVGVSVGWERDVRRASRSDGLPTMSAMETTRGRRLVRYSLLTLIGVPIGIVVAAVWSTIVKTSPTVADDERIRGWGSVVRDLPATAFLFAIVAIGLALAVHAGRLGNETDARRAILWHGAALFFILLVVINGATENIMTTRPATVKWLLLPAQVAIAAGVVMLCRRRARPLQ